MTQYLTYNISDVEPYINWAYFRYAWGVGNGSSEAARQLHDDAMTMLEELRPHYHTHAAFALSDAFSDGDDLLLGSVRLPLLRQQQPAKGSSYCRSLADFVRPLGHGEPDKVGIFATTVDRQLADDHSADDYQHLLAVTLADRLAEATAERLHEEVRRTIWGYAPDEHYEPRQLFSEPYQGIRPAVGYPSMPDMSINFIINDMIDMSRIGITLTESGMMVPHSSVSGLMLAHPRAVHFSIGKIGEDQLADYARRRGMTVERMRHFVKTAERAQYADIQQHRQHCCCHAAH